MVAKFDENDVFIIGDFRDKPVYIGDVFSKVSLDKNKGQEVLEHDGLRCHFIASVHDSGILKVLRERRDEINESQIQGAETIKIYSDLEIKASDGIFISEDGDPELLIDSELSVPSYFGSDPFS